ncbi:hypothetical protein Tco_1285597 [Tanacetum coccineum]
MGINRLTAVKAFAVIAAYPLHIDFSCVLDHVIVELTAFLYLHMTALALELCCTLMSDRRYGPTVRLTVRNIVLPHALALVKSSSLQGQALLENISFVLWLGTEGQPFHVVDICCCWCML